MTTKTFMAVVVVLLVVAGFAFGYGTGQTVTEKKWVGIAIDMCDMIPECEHRKTVGGFALWYTDGFEHNDTTSYTNSMVGVNFSVE